MYRTHWKSFVSLTAVFTTIFTVTTPSFALRATGMEENEEARNALASTLKSAAGLEQAKEFTLDSSQGRMLVKHLGPAPAGAAVHGVVWVPVRDIKEGMVRVYTAPNIARGVLRPHSLLLSARLVDGVTVDELDPKTVPTKLGAVIVQLVPGAIELRSPHAPDVRFGEGAEVTGLLDALAMVAWSRAMRNRVLYWAPRSAERVQLAGHDGYGFYV